MPSYVYRCREHGEFEVIRKAEEAGAPAFCDCGQSATRVWSMPGVVFACDGFHKTDYSKGDNLPGTKRERMMQHYKDVTGEDPPPDPPDLPRNSTEKY